MNDTPPKDPQDQATEDNLDAMDQTSDVANAADAPDPISELSTESVLLKQVLEYKAAAQRATADYRNLQRETDKRVGDMRKFATESLLADICPLVDYFDSAFKAIPEEQKSAGWVQGVKHIQDYLMQILKTNGVERMTTIGQSFNPEFHESVGEEVSDQPEHTVVKEMQAGFTLNGKVIRHARVMIASGTAQADAPSAPDAERADTADTAPTSNQ